MEWVESRRDAVRGLLQGMDADSHADPATRYLASSLGLPEDLLLVLRVDVLGDGVAAVDNTVEAWRGWLFGWMRDHPEHVTGCLEPRTSSNSSVCALGAYLTTGSEFP